MKKTFTTILILVLAIELVLPSVQPARAATQKRRLNSIYKRELNNFLVNYRGSTPDRQGCRRTSAKPNGETSDCLSRKKIVDILTQLDNDGYFQMAQPDVRRVYLTQTPNQVYVMRKVVMYFEETLNRYTTLYTPTMRAKDNLTANDILLKDDGVETWTKGEGAILAMATTREELAPDLYEYRVKPKGFVPLDNLAFLYGYDESGLNANTPLGEYQANNDGRHRDWTQPEYDIIQRIVENANGPINLIRRVNLTPKTAHKVTETVKQANDIVTIGSVLIPVAGGVSLLASAPRGASLAEVFQIGTSQVRADSFFFESAFQKSKISTSSAVATKGLSRAVKGLDMVANANRKWVPDVDTLLADAATRIRFLPQARKPLKGYPGLYASSEKTIYYSDEYLLKNMNLNFDPVSGKPVIDASFVHEPEHELRHIMSERYGFQFYEYPNVEELITDGSANAIIRANSMELSPVTGGYSYRTLYNDLVAAYVRRNNRGVYNLALRRQYIDRLFQIKDTTSLGQIDADLGNPGFIHDLETILENVAYFHKEASSKEITNSQRAAALRGWEYYMKLAHNHIGEIR